LTENLKFEDALCTDSLKDRFEIQQIPQN